MVKKRFLVPLAIILSLLVLYCFDRVYYRDKKPFISPIQHTGGNIPLRSDSFGSGHFGAKRKNGRVHKGLDILAPVGTPVMAAKSGWAVADERPDGYGRYVTIYHTRDLATRYAHLDGVNVKWVKKVRQGDIIGIVGKSGNANYASIKPHLHFEVLKNGVHQDPLKGYLK